MKTNAMKINFTFFGLLFLLSVRLSAQNLTCANLINEVYGDSQIIKPNTTNNPPVNYAKPGTQILDVKYLGDSLSGGGARHGCNASNDCTDGSSNLVYEVYYPNIQYSDTKKLSAFIFFHDGGFSDCTNFHSGTETQTYCMEFAKRGFVVFNVEYRRGKVEDSIGRFTSASRLLALYRSIQDARGAIRTIVSKELSKATTYRINVRRIFLGGPSSGAVMALLAGCYNSKMINQIFPNVSSVLGSVDADKYLGNASASSYTIKGILNLWGEAYVPLSFASNPTGFFAQTSQHPALISFHGGSDPVVKIDSSSLLFSPSTSKYNSELLCVNGTYTLPDNGANKGDLKSYGSRGLYNIFKTLMNIPCELYIDCDMSHSLNESTSDFGLANGDASAVTNKQVEVYITQRAATFFQYLVNANFPYTLTHTKFIDCLNTRYGCNSDSGTTCNESATCIKALKKSSAQKNLLVKKDGNALFTATTANKTVYIKFFKPGHSTIMLFNMNGVPVKSLNTSGTAAVLEGTNLASGIYLLKIMQGNKTQIAKIVLQ